MIFIVVNFKTEDLYCVILIAYLQYSYMDCMLLNFSSSNLLYLAGSYSFVLQTRILEDLDVIFCRTKVLAIG